MCNTKMTDVEHLSVYHKSCFPCTKCSTFDSSHEADIQKWENPVDYDSMHEDSSRSSVESCDSGYQSESPEHSPKSKRCGRDLHTPGTPILTLNRGQEEKLVRKFQEPEDLRLDSKEETSFTQELEKFDQCVLELEKIPVIGNQAMLCVKETAIHNDDEEKPEGRPIIPQYIVEKGAVRHLQESVHQLLLHKVFHLEPVLAVSQSRSEAVPKCKEENLPQREPEVSWRRAVPQSKDEGDPSWKDLVVPQVEKRVAHKSMNEGDPQSEDNIVIQHKEREEALEPQTKDKEPPPCKCGGVSRLCEHWKDSKLRHRKKNDPLFSKKRLRRLFRGQFKKLYIPEDLEEPPFQYVPEVLPTSASIKGVVPPLQESLMLLGEGLEAGSLVAQFEQLYRRKPGLTVTEARRQDNEKKNRYRDISPYDSTRVILTTASSGDYINASYVNMEVQASGIVNRYIASQGPLAGTCTDFWHMVWEQQSTLIVMLTTVVEQGRVKCHRYWPRLYETVDFGILQVTCNKEEETPGFAFREFTLINTETQEERHITHMQYLAWPDHGVPDDSTEFLNFVTQVRKARAGMVEPTIVHCSAGIGRTGVLILMETAQCLIEANEPIYPLDIVKAMRDQRAMMIQTASQFRFVCEAIHRVYTEELIKPLAEYEQR